MTNEISISRDPDESLYNFNLSRFHVSLVVYFQRDIRLLVNREV